MRKPLWIAVGACFLAACTVATSPPAIVPTPPAVPTATMTPPPAEPAATPPPPTAEPAQPTPPPAATAAPTTPPSPEVPTQPPVPPTPTLIEPAGVSVRETTVTIPTYGYQDALVPSNPDDPIYPYPHLDFDAVSDPVPKDYHAVVLENAYVQVVVLPELGGRILRWKDKTTGRVLTYQNPVIKPTYWGYRGWWLATGGLEWCLPVEEHGLNEYRPWRYAIGAGSVTVSDHEDRSGLDVSIQISLDAEHNGLVIRPAIRNATPSPQKLQFWINAMLSLADNQASEQLRFILPAGEVLVHSSDDSSLPPAGQPMPWPVYQGRDLSSYANWRGYLGFFAHPASAGFMGLYDTATGQGVVRVFPRQAAPGAKFFGGKGLDPALWTDDGSSYVELWGGWTPTFWDDGTLEPGREIGWTEYWYPVSGLPGGFDSANGEAALRLDDRGNSVWVGIATSRNLYDGRAVLYRGGQRVAEWVVTAGPGHPFGVLWPKAGAGEWGLQLLGADGKVLAQMGGTP